ncbi:hypothetical protein HELRODRAFT_70673, partial [Helobdella robusta]|uniref:protein-tyrosine-phosphatase n=1 Tax=Helobdella robusta TaxID=6412 RepID=T1G0A5_HELRO
MTELADGLFMGNQKHADDHDLLKRYRITHVVNCAGNSKLAITNPSYPFFKQQSKDNYNISAHFMRAIEFLDQSEKEGGRALVHCNLGVNRSGAIVAAFLMNRYKMNLLRTIDYLKRKRTVVLSNRGFRKQLVKF